MVLTRYVFSSITGGTLVTVPGLTQVFPPTFPTYTYAVSSLTETINGITRVTGGSVGPPFSITVTPPPFPTASPVTPDPSLNSVPTVWTSGPSGPICTAGCGHGCFVCVPFCPICPPGPFPPFGGGGAYAGAGAGDGECQTETATSCTSTCSAAGCASTCSDVVQCEPTGGSITVSLAPAFTGIADIFPTTTDDAAITSAGNAMQSVLDSIYGTTTTLPGAATTLPGTTGTVVSIPASSMPPPPAPTPTDMTMYWIDANDGNIEVVGYQMMANPINPCSDGATMSDTLFFQNELSNPPKANAVLTGSFSFNFTGFPCVWSNASPSTPGTLDCREGTGIPVITPCVLAGEVPAGGCDIHGTFVTWVSQSFC